MEFGVIGILALFADVYVILKIAQNLASDAGKALWIGIIILLPMLGIIAWYLIAWRAPGNRCGFYPDIQANTTAGPLKPIPLMLLNCR
jgi:hypothetical protein